MKKYFLYLLFFTITFNGNCSFWYKDIEFVDVENFKVARGDKKIAISFDYVIKNPNWYSIVIKPSTINLTIAGTDCGYVRINEKLKIKKKTTGRYNFILYGNTSDYVKSTFSSIWNMFTQRKVDFVMKGAIKAGAMGMTLKIKLDYTYEMTYKEFMSFF